MNKYCFYNDIIDTESFDSSLLKIDKKSYKEMLIEFIFGIRVKMMQLT